MVSPAKCLYEHYHAPEASSPITNTIFRARCHLPSDCPGPISSTLLCFPKNVGFPKKYREVLCEVRLRKICSTLSLLRESGPGLCPLEKPPASLQFIQVVQRIAVSCGECSVVGRQGHLSTLQHIPTGIVLKVLDAGVPHPCSLHVIPLQ